MKKHFFILTLCLINFYPIFSSANKFSQKVSEPIQSIERAIEQMSLSDMSGAELALLVKYRKSRQRSVNELFSAATKSRKRESIIIGSPREALESGVSIK